MEFFEEDLIFGDSVCLKLGDKFNGFELLSKYPFYALSCVKKRSTEFLFLSVIWTPTILSWLRFSIFFYLDFFRSTLFIRHKKILFFNLFLFYSMWLILFRGLGEELNPLGLGNKNNYFKRWKMRNYQQLYKI